MLLREGGIDSYYIDKGREESALLGRTNTGSRSYLFTNYKQSKNQPLDGKRQRIV